MAARRTRLMQAPASELPHADAGQSITVEVQGLDANTIPAPDVGTVIASIEGILETIVDALQAREQLSIGFATRRANRGLNDRRQEQIYFPGRTVQEARKFAQVLLILQLSHDALVSGTVLTKRHIFYQHQDLFESQRQVDDLVDDIAFTLNVRRGDLNIVAASKGVVTGGLAVRLRDGTSLNAASGDLGMPIPAINAISRIDVSTARWILVLEKDAIFRSLCSSRFWHMSLYGPGVLITAKGYPDLTTRSFLNFVNANTPELPIFALVDYDPDGIGIMRCYRFGSDRLRHEQYSQTPSMRWLGIKSGQLMSMATPTANYSKHGYAQTQWNSHLNHASPATAPPRNPFSSTACRDPISYLTARDRQVAISTLRKLTGFSTINEGFSEMKRELQSMLMLGAKAEIEWLDESGNLCQWLDDALGAALSQVT